MSVRRTLEPDDQLARYRVIEPLGTGGMGEVYLAKDESLRRPVALKILPPRLMRNEERVRRFIREARSASSLSHPNIVAIYEIGLDRVRAANSAAGDGSASQPPSDPLHFIAMELVVGETLARKIHDAKEDLRKLIGWLAQAADGIAKAHAAGVIHRDLKPGNIMVSDDGFAKVLDFGVAKLTEREIGASRNLEDAPTETVATREGAVIGTPGYMSPEQVLGRPADARSDVFSMGCALYEAATRRHPFVADTPIEVMHRILRDRPAPVEEIAPEVPAEVRRIIRRCLAKNPDQRFQSMKDLAIELHEVHDEFDSLPSGADGAQPISGTSESSGKRSAFLMAPGKLGASGQARRRVAVGIAAALMLVALVASLRSRDVDEASARGTLMARDTKLSVLMSREDLREAVLSSDGRFLAYVTTADGKTALTARQVRTGSDVTIVAPQAFAIRGISFSPDGDYLYYLNSDLESPAYSALFQVPSVGGTPRKVAFDVDTTATVSPDGRQVCFSRGKLDVESDTLVVADLASGKEREIARVHAPENFASAPGWSPDGKHVAVATQRWKGGLRSWVTVFDADGRGATKLDSGRFVSIESVAWLPDGQSLVFTGAPKSGATWQVFSIGYPGGEVRRITNDLAGYEGVSVASKGASIAAIRRTDVTNAWIAPLQAGQQARSVTSATGAAGSSGEPMPLPGGSLAVVIREGEGFRLQRISQDGSDRYDLDGEGMFGTIRFAEKAGLVFDKESEDAIPHVWRVDPDGSGLRQLTEGAGEGITDLSRDGKIATIARFDLPTSIFTLDPSVEGESKNIVSSATADPPLISPDGSKISYSDVTTINGRIFIRHVIAPSSGGAPLAQLLLPPSVVVPDGTTATRWAPDGEAITYVDSNQGWNVMRQPITGGPPAQLTHFTEGQTSWTAWSPNGEWIAVVRHIGQREGLWLVRPGKSEPRLLTDFRTGTISQLMWTQDSKNVLFTYGTSGKDLVLISDYQ